MGQKELEIRQIFTDGHRFNMDFLCAQWDELAAAAATSNLKVAELIRLLVAHYLGLLKAYLAEHPEQETIRPETVLVAADDEVRDRLKVEHQKWEEQLEKLQLAQEIEGGPEAIDYKIAPKIVELHWRAHLQGKSFKAMVAEDEQELAAVAERAAARGPLVDVDELGNLRPKRAAEGEPALLRVKADPMQIKMLKEENAKLVADNEFFRRASLWLVALVLAFAVLAGGAVAWLVFAR
jgi:hypothetical protein